MKILVIQLARLGDIYMSWPAMRALRRKHPQAEIHFMVRPRFEAAVNGLEAIDRVIQFRTDRLMAPLLEEPQRLGEALQRTGEILQALREEDYDLIVNWTFSPLSSWIVKSVAGPACELMGYGRHRDGSLQINDDVSAFFYAQVGTERPNRIHLTDLFATMIDMDLAAADWAAPRFPSAMRLPDAYWVLHPGASEEHKKIAPWQWGRLIQEYATFAGDDALPVVLIGSPDEISLAKQIGSAVNRLPIVDLVGKTKVTELFEVLGGARLFVGADSGPVHIASLTDTPTLNVSAGRVNFWETGPKAKKSWVYPVADSGVFPSALLGARVAQLIQGDEAEDLLAGAGGVPAFVSRLPRPDDFEWGLIQALYLGTEFPVADSLRFFQVVEKIREMNDVVLEQLANPRLEAKALGALMDRADEVFQVLGDADPGAGVLVRWMQTERVRIPPMEVSSVRCRMEECHSRFAVLLRPYCLEEGEKEGRDGSL